MKTLVIVLVIFITLGCNSTSQFSQKGENIQLCLDRLYYKMGYKPLENYHLILVKDAYTSELNNLHFGKSKLILKEVPQSSIKMRYSPGDDTSKIYFKIGCDTINGDRIALHIGLDNNRIFTFYLKKREPSWRIDSVKTSIR